MTIHLHLNLAVLWLVCAVLLAAGLVSALHELRTGPTSRVVAVIGLLTLAGGCAACIVAFTYTY